MQAIRALEDLKSRLEAQIATTQADLEAVARAIRLLERETPETLSQMSPEAANVAGNTPRPIMPAGLSDLCRQIIEDQWIAPLNVRDRLMELGYPNTDKHRLLSSVYATLKRLADNGELESRKIDGASTEFRRRPQIQAA
jgi:hypothetical protein